MVCLQELALQGDICPSGGTWPRILLLFSCAQELQRFLAIIHFDAIQPAYSQ